jgi:hypothetical protein
MNLPNMAGPHYGKVSTSTQRSWGANPRAASSGRATCFAAHSPPAAKCKNARGWEGSLHCMPPSQLRR